MNKKFSVLIKNKIKKYNKKITVDSDKSITHRCYYFASQCLGISKIKGLNSKDVEATINGLRKLGIMPVIVFLETNESWFLVMALMRS